MGNIRRRRKSSASSDESITTRLIVDSKPRVAYAKRKKPDKPIVIGFQVKVFSHI